MGSAIHCHFSGQYCAFDDRLRSRWFDLGRHCSGAYPLRGSSLVLFEFDSKESHWLAMASDDHLLGSSGSFCLRLGHSKCLDTRSIVDVHDDIDHRHYHGGVQRNFGWTCSQMASNSVSEDFFFFCSVLIDESRARSRTNVNEEIPNVSSTETNVRHPRLEREGRESTRSQREDRAPDEVALLNNTDDETAITIDVRQETSARKKVVLFPSNN